MADRSDRQPRPGLRAAGVERNRHAILRAARDHLVAAGYPGLSLEQVAADAGVTRVTIYRRFESKLGLLDAVAEDLAERSGVVPGIAEAAAVPDAADAFRAMVTQFCRFWSTDPDLFRRLISLAAVDPEAEQVLGARERWRYDRVAEFVRRLADDDRLRSGFRIRQASAIVAAVTGFPSCDEMASRLNLDHRRLDSLLVPALDGVVRLA